MLAEMANLYYKQGKTQSEIARYFDTNRFRVAKLLQEALNENIVEIHINYSSERNKEMEKRLMECYPLRKAMVVNTRYSSGIETQSRIGKVGANYLTRLLEETPTIGIAWGKTVYSVISQFPSGALRSVSAVQLTGDPRMTNPLFDSRELVRAAATAFQGSYYYLNAPIYLASDHLKQSFYQEPVIRETRMEAKKMGVVISGIGGMSSIPLENPHVQPYLTEQDLAAGERCIGSLYGYTLDEHGQIADIDLNRKLVSVDLQDLMNAPHRLVVGYGRHKVHVMVKALESGLYNELLTDDDTAQRMIEEKLNQNGSQPL